jgi:hypothetical protein
MATVAQLGTGQWVRPMSCINTLDADLDDGPAIHYDIGAPNFWAVAHELGTGNVCGPNSGANKLCLYIYQNCSGYNPWPGTAGCRLTWSGPITSDIVGHGTIAVNPATHHGLVAYRDTNSNIRLRVYNTNGALVRSLIVATGMGYGSPATCTALGCAGASFGAVPKCGGCGDDCGDTGEDGCVALMSKVHQVTRYTLQGNAYLYLGWDALCPNNGSDGQRHMKSFFMILDITDEIHPVMKTTFVSGSCNAPGYRPLGNDYGAAISTASGPDSSGIFVYSQSDTGVTVDPCSTRYMAYIGSGAVPAVLNGTFLTDSFPTMRFFTAHGMSDYTAAVKNGLLGGYHYPTWSQPINTGGAECVTCQEQEYGLRVLGTRIQPN